MFKRSKQFSFSIRQPAAFVYKKPSLPQDRTARQSNKGHEKDIGEGPTTGHLECPQKD
jgi:hypothetical protein